LKDVTDKWPSVQPVEKVETPIREWDMGKNKKMQVKQYECCGKRFREYGKRV